MPFWPDSTAGLLYMAAVIGCLIIALRWGSPQFRQVMVILTVHWVLLRTIDVVDHENFIYWCFHDATFAIALAWPGSGRRGKACASLLVLLLAFDTYSYFAGGTFEAASAVAETIGYLSMILAGAPDVGNWIRRRRSDRRSSNLVHLVSRGPAKHLTGLHRSSLAE
jgi:hypothetical protein